MMNFLKNFLNGEKSAEEQGLLAAQKKRDVLTVDAAAEDEDENCDTQPTGCCGGGCRG